MMRSFWNSRGAMFGLDARIALAIFSALGIATGAMIYKAATQSRYTAVAAEFNNIAKAFGDYTLDVGTPPNRIEDLITSGAANWNGPYVTYADNVVGSNAISIKVAAQPFDLSIKYYPDHVADADAMDVLCEVDNCWGWLSFSADRPYMEKLDRAIDGTTDSTRGNMRYEAAVAVGSVGYFRLGSVRMRAN